MIKIFHATSWTITIFQSFGLVLSLGYVIYSPPTIFNFLSILTGYILLSWIGNSIFFHRYVSHKSFKTNNIFKFFGTLLGCLAGRGSPIDWAAIHRFHHQHSDTEMDPHNPKLEGWRLFIPILLKYNQSFSPRIVIDLLKDPLYRILQTYYWLIIITFIIILGIIDLNSLMYWYIIPMTITNLLLTCTVYILHTWGEKLNDKDNSRNNMYINLLQGGEGWHSNHHLTPGKYRMGPFDPCARIIDLIKI